MLDAMQEVDVRNLRIHDTADTLSHQIAGLWWWRAVGLTACSSTSQCIRMPSNWRLDMVISPFGLVFAHSQSYIDCGYL